MITIDPTAVIEPTAILRGDVTIGARSYVGHYTVIGTPPEHGSHRYAATGREHGSRVVIGADVEIREHVTIHAPMGLGGVTRIGARAMVMSHAHIGHDVEIGEDVKICTGAVLGGHTIVQTGANVGLNATTHQHSTIGAYAMVGMGAVVTRDVPPTAIVRGAPARWHGVNIVGLSRAGYDAGQIAAWFQTHGEEMPPPLREWVEAFLAATRRACLEVGK